MQRFSNYKLGKMKFLFHYWSRINNSYQSINSLKVKLLSYNNDYIFLFHLFFNYNHIGNMNFYKLNSNVDNTISNFSIQSSPLVVKILCINRYRNITNN